MVYVLIAASMLWLIAMVAFAVYVLVARRR